MRVMWVQVKNKEGIDRVQKLYCEFARNCFAMVDADCILTLIGVALHRGVGAMRKLKSYFPEYVPTNSQVQNLDITIFGT